jgi:hypothetical protein
VSHSADEVKEWSGQPRGVPPEFPDYVNADTLVYLVQPTVQLLLRPGELTLTPGLPRSGAVKHPPGSVMVTGGVQAPPVEAARLHLLRCREVRAVECACCGCFRG